MGVAKLIGQRCIDSIANFVGNFLTHIAQHVGNGRINLRADTLVQAVFNLACQRAIQPIKYARKNVVGEQV